MKQISINTLLLSVIFVLSISLPMSISFFSENASVSQTEKRALAQFPEIRLSPALLQEFPAAFDSYIEDHFGFRERIVRTHNYLLVSLFGVSPSAFVIVGSNDWYFFNADGSINDYLGSMKIGSRRLENIYYLLQDRTFWLNSIGSQYLFLPVPNKEMIYDEYLPAQIRQHKGESNYERVLGYLEEKQHFQGYIDLKQVMLKAKDEGLLYLRTDSHWNHDGTFLAYREIISKMRFWYPDMIALEKSPERKTIYNFSGDLSILMNLRGLITEDAPDVVVDTTCEARQLKRMDSIRTIPKYRDLETHRLPVEGGCETRKYTAVVLHDSFGRFLEPYLSQQFARVIYINFLNFEDAKEIIERERPDIVIDQRVARNLLKAVRPDNELQ
ncbi:MAG: hypothetical protein V2I35_02680, partial [Desulfocapsaceae bacterium]|nr:hypothetical protein [Desulfocapsaceae bacterium]